MRQQRIAARDTRFLRPADFDAFQIAERALVGGVIAADGKDPAVLDLDPHRRWRIDRIDIDHAPADGNFAGFVDPVVDDVASFDAIIFEGLHIEQITRAQHRRDRGIGIGCGIGLPRRTGTGDADQAGSFRIGMPVMEPAQCRHALSGNCR